MLPIAHLEAMAYSRKKRIGMKFGKRSMSAILAFFVVIALVVSACGSDEETPPTATSRPAATNTPVAAATAAPVAAATPTPPTPTATPVPPTPTPSPRLGGIFTTRVSSDPNPANDFHKARSADSFILPLQPLVNSLIRYGAYNETTIEPDLAESYTQSADGMTWTFKIRQGVKWHDGNPLTVDDVVFSLLRMSKRQPAFSPLLGSVFATVDTVTAPDPSTVVVKLTRPTLVFLSGLLSTHAVVLPKHTGEDFGTKRIGSGPFKFGSSRPGNVTTLVKNPDYFVRGSPYLDQIEAYTIPDNGAALAAFQTGRLHWTNVSTQIVNAVNAPQLRSSLPGVQILESAGGMGILFINTVAPFTDARVRQAMHLAIDRPAYVQVALFGAGNPFAVDGLPAATIWAMPADEVKALPGWRTPKTQDLAQAKALMEQAGFSERNPLKTSVVVSGAQFGEQATVIATQLRAIYIDMAVEATDMPTVLQRRTTGTFATHFSGVAPVVDDPAGYYGRFYLPGVAENYAKYDLPDINRLYKEQDETADRAVRIAKLRELQRKSVELSWWITAAETSRFQALSRQVIDFPRQAVGVNSNGYRFERVWLTP